MHLQIMNPCDPLLSKVQLNHDVENLNIVKCFGPCQPAQADMDRYLLQIH